MVQFNRPRYLKGAQMTYQNPNSRNRHRNLRRKKQSDRERLITAHDHDTIAERKRIEQLYAESVDYFAVRDDKE